MEREAHFSLGKARMIMFYTNSSDIYVVYFIKMVDGHIKGMNF